MCAHNGAIWTSADGVQSSNPSPIYSGVAQFNMSVLTRYSSWLSNAPWGVDRFRPRSLDETMASIFEFWNLLDAIMRQHSTIPWMYGYVRELQAWHMVQLVRSMPQTHLHYCEVGMNGAHSTAAMLLSSPNLTVHAFDFLAYRYSAPIATMMRTRFGSRFDVHPGNSRDTLAAWVGESSKHRCDILLVDGDHTVKGSRQDILDLWPAASRGRSSALLWVDDVVPACHGNSQQPSSSRSGARLWSRAVEERHCATLKSNGVKPESRVNAGPGLAVKGLIEEGVLEPLETHGPFMMGSRLNPCLRGHRGPLCRKEWDWGYSLLRFKPFTNSTSTSETTPSSSSKAVKSWSGKRWKAHHKTLKKRGWDQTCSSRSCLQIQAAIRAGEGPWAER